MTATIDKALLEAERTGDAKTLVRLYRQAADLHEERGNIDAACFFLTHAYVFALEDGAAEAATLNQRLAQFGREELQMDW